MNSTSLPRIIFAVESFLVLPLAFAASAGLMRLPPPQTEGGMPLMQALKQRQSARAFSPQPLPPQILSNLLWAAWGINRPGKGGRTAPSAHDVQDMDVYVVMADGAWRYDARSNALLEVRKGDLRALTGKQDFVKDAAVNLVYVSDFSRFSRDSEADRMFYSAADAGHISQNVYLYCASESLAVVVRAYIDKPALSKALGLKPAQRIVLAQSVGYPG